MDLKKIGLFVGGVLFGTAGISILSGKDAKKVYTHCTAAVLRGKDGVMNTVATVKENCEDIYADAKDINAVRYEEVEKEELAVAKSIVEQYENFCEEECAAENAENVE